MNEIIVQNDICIIKLDNKPENYLKKPEFISKEKLERTIGENKSKAIIITGTGRHFSAGADVNNIKTFLKKGTLRKEMEKGKELLSSLTAFNIPVIACVEGVCFGGGLEIVLHADIKIVSEKSLFAFPESNLNLIPGLGGSVKLSQITGKAKAAEFILSGNMINAQEAKELAIADYVVKAKNTLYEGLKLAKMLTEGKKREVIEAVVELIRKSGDTDYDALIKRETELFCKLAAKAAENDEL